MSRKPRPSEPEDATVVSLVGREAAGKPATARTMLRPESRDAVPWAVFDLDWYLAAYPEAAADLPNVNFYSVLRQYLDVGQAAGHSPNMYFDETWYRACNPDVVVAISEGRVESGFDHYCRDGFRDRSPHWLFDEKRYRELYRDITDAALVECQLPNGYAHYLMLGDKEGRINSPFFDPEMFAACLAKAEIDAPPEDGLFTIYLRLSGMQPECRTTKYFDPEWYRATYPEAVEAIARGAYRNALHHYLTNPTPLAFDPLPVFSEQIYISANPDVAHAVAIGQFRCGYLHFLANGAAELRAAGPRLDLQWYYSNNAKVRADLAAGRAPDAFAHYLTIGQAMGLTGAPPPDPAEREPAPMMLYRARGSAPLPTVARRGLDFTCTGVPAVSVIMLLRDEFTVTLQSLAALRDRMPGPMELVLIDRDSHDETRHIHRYVRGARVLRFDLPLGAAAMRSAALGMVGAPIVLLLGSDTEPAHDAIAAALDRFADNPDIGAIGGRIVGPDGRLRTAGGIIWRDGSLTHYMRDAPALAPEANFVRDVDFCSSDLLLARTAVLQQLEGFDTQFTTPDYGDADLCLRIITAGHRVVCDPNVLGFQLGVNEPVKGGEEETAAFFRKHIDRLRFRYLPDPKVEIFARALDKHRERLLFLEDMVPLRMIGSGFVRSNDLVRVLASMGVFVTVFPLRQHKFDIAAVYADMPDTVEVMHDRSLADLGALFNERVGYYDLIWVARTHNLERILLLLKQATTGTGRPPLVVLDTEAITALREAALHRLTGQDADFDVDAAILKEFANAHHCQSISVVTQQEAAILRDLGFSDVKVIGHIRDLAPTPRAFEERSGILFVGAIHEIPSPNYDGLCWFVDEVLPLIEAELGWETRLSVVGYTGAGVTMDRFRAHARVTLRGAVVDTTPLYNAHRVFIAPARYAAGSPYKVYEAASFGLPVVATELLREQVGWEDGKEILAADAADPARFAAQVVRLYRDAALWQSVRDNALARLAAENGRDQYVRVLNEILER